MPSDWTADEIRRIGYRVVDLIADHLTTLPGEPVFRPVPPELAQAFALDAGTAGSGFARRHPRRVSTRQIEPYPFGNGHPRFWGWVNSPPAVMGVFADALAAAMNPSCAGGNHAAIYLERQVTGWFRDMLGFPAGSMGLLVSGGSMATMTALAVARHVKSGVDVRARRLARRAGAVRLLHVDAKRTAARARRSNCSDSAARRCGRSRPTPTTGCSVDALDAAIADDLARGVRPIAVIATGGSTNTGAIDDLAAIAGVCRRHDVWMHVDAAYGGPAILSTQYAGALRAIAQADSVALDPHKWLFVPVEAGLVAGARRRGDAIDVQPGAALHPAVRQRRRGLRPAVVQRVRLPADARLPRAEGLDDAAAVRADGLSRRRSRRTSRSPAISPIACARRRISS